MEFIRRRQSNSRRAAVEALALELSEEERCLWAWTAGLVLAEAGLVPATRFLCLSCACVVTDKGFKPAPDRRPVCQHCGKLSRAHTCFAPASVEWTTWKSICRNINPDIPPAFHYETLIEEIRLIFTEEALKAAPDGAFGLLLNIGRRRHIQNVLPVLSRRWLELHDQHAETEVQTQIRHLFTELCLDLQLPLISSIVLKRHHAADQRLKGLSDIDTITKTFILDRRFALHFQINAKKAAWKVRRSKYTGVFASITVAMRHNIIERRAGLSKLLRRLNIASVEAHRTALQKVSHRLESLAALPNHRSALQQKLTRFIKCLYEELEKPITTILIYCSQEPVSATADLFDLLEKRDVETCSVDRKLIQGWVKNQNNSFPMIAARGAEHLALAWVKSWGPPEDRLQDISRLQIETPTDASWRRGDIRRIADKDKIETLYDVKNTCVSHDGFRDLRVKHTVDGKTEGIHYIGVITEGWFFVDSTKAIDIPKVPIPVHVAGIYNKLTRQKVVSYVKAQALSVSLGETDLWSVDAKYKQETWVPAFLFVMPPQAWNPFRGRRLPERLWDLLDTQRTSSLLGFFTDNDKLKHRLPSSFITRIDILLMQAIKSGRAPWLPMVYLTVLDSFVSAFNAITSGSATEDTELILEESQAIFFGNDYRAPLGAWDPSEAVYVVVRAFGAFLAQVRKPTGSKHMPTITRIHLNAAGTIIAEDNTGKRITLVCHCERKYPPGQPPSTSYDRASDKKCQSWPLIFGNENSQYPQLPQARSCEKCKRLLCGKGHGCSGSDPDDLDCLWNQVRKGLHY